MDKYLSVITNFGCHELCPYCIVRKNGINVPETTISGLYNLLKEYHQNKCNIISISGGGDPLHNYKFHKDYYNSLLELCDNNFIPIELHTSYVKSNFPVDKCIRVVYHLRDKESLKNVKRQGNERVRIVYVVTSNFTKEDIDYIHDFVSDSKEIDELSFRQMVDGSYQTTYYCADYLEEYHKKRWYYIKQDDYNLYYVNGKVFTHFNEIHG